MNDENLEKGSATRFKAGQSGNPGGRPRNRPISDRLRELVEDALPEAERIRLGLSEGATYGDGLVKVLADLALAGKIDAIRDIRDSIEGKTAPRTERPDLANRTVELLVKYDPSIFPSNSPNVSPVAVSLPIQAKSN